MSRNSNTIYDEVTRSKSVFQSLALSAAKTNSTPYRIIPINLFWSIAKGKDYNIDIICLHKRSQSHIKNQLYIAENQKAENLLETATYIVGFFTPMNIYPKGN